MREFAEKTGPAIEHYRASGRFADIDGMTAPEAVTSDIRAALYRLRGGV